MPNKVKNLKGLVKNEVFVLFGMELKKQNKKKKAKIGKNEKMQCLIRCLKSKKQFKINL